jgi:hypothetical protein
MTVAPPTVFVLAAVEGWPETSEFKPWKPRRVEREGMQFATTETAVVDKPAEEEDHGRGHRGHTTR